MKRVALGFGAVAVLALVALAAIATSASATAIVRDSVTTPFSESGVPDDCRPGVTGSVEGTQVTEFQSVETSAGFHVTGTTTATGRVEWSDGTYTTIESVDHFAFNAAAAGATVFTQAHEDSGDTYAADGAFLFRVTFHLVERFTVSGGLTRVEFERGHLHVFGDC